jgi:Catalase
MKRQTIRAKHSSRSLSGMDQVQLARHESLDSALALAGGVFPHPRHVVGHHLPIPGRPTEKGTDYFQFAMRCQLPEKSISTTAVGWLNSEDEVQTRVVKESKTNQNKGRPNPLTTTGGNPVADNQSSRTAGPRGPLLMPVDKRLEQIAHKNRKRMPARTVHAKGAGAYNKLTISPEIVPWPGPGAVNRKFLTL